MGGTTQARPSTAINVPINTLCLEPAPGGLLLYSGYFVLLNSTWICTTTAAEPKHFLRLVSILQATHHHNQQPPPPPNLEPVYNPSPHYAHPAGLWADASHTSLVIILSGYCSTSPRESPESKSCLPSSSNRSSHFLSSRYELLRVSTHFCKPPLFLSPPQRDLDAYAESFGLSIWWTFLSPLARLCTRE